MLYLEDELLEVLIRRYHYQYSVSERHAAAFIEIENILKQAATAVQNARRIGAEDERIGG